jgi:hypothetical protein
VKDRTLTAFALKKPPQSVDTSRVLRMLLNLCHRPVVRFGLRRDFSSRFRDPRFVSFLAESNRRSRDSDFQDSLLRGRKMVRHLLRFALAGGAAWVVLESAKALTVF